MPAYTDEMTHISIAPRLPVVVRTTVSHDSRWFWSETIQYSRRGGSGSRFIAGKGHNEDTKRVCNMVEGVQTSTQ